MDWFKKLMDAIKENWEKWSLVQKIILIGVVVAVIGAVVLTFALSSTPSRVAVLGVPFPDDQSFNAAVTRLDQEGIPYQITEDRRLFVSDLKTAQNVRAILIRENLVPSSVDPWSLFDIERWTITDFERNINVRRAITAQVTNHIKSLSDIDDATVVITMPEESLFRESQKPVTASVTITPKPGSDITTNRRKIEGIMKLVMFAVEGLKAENVVITDRSGTVLNDFAGLENLDRLELARREMKTKRELEERYMAYIQQSLSGIYTADRVRIVNLDIQLETDKTTVNREEYFPITRRPDNPRTPFDDSEIIDNIRLSESTKDVTFQGSGFNPEGPPGQEGQTPPAYKDLEGLVGTYTDKSNTVNYVVNKEISQIERGPYRIRRVTIGVALDGVWKRKYNENGEVILTNTGAIDREYIPLNDQEVAAAKSLIEPAVGFNRDRGDVVTVQHVQFDRTAQFEKEDAEYRAALQTQRTIFWSIIGLISLIIIFIIFRLIAQEMERRRRLREEELARQHQAMREAALRSAEEESADVEMSVADRARLELQETVMNMAREHPADVAQLIRTWLNED